MLPRMRFGVSTVRDTPANVADFVTANLAGGLDHLVVFLDDPGDAATPVVLDQLQDHPHVTCVVTDDTWWQGKRPEQLNVRQRTNANLVKALLTRVDRAEWVFHIDADEVVRLDPKAMDAVPASARAVQLRPLEAVSTLHPDARPTLFKSLLSPDELTLLHVLGVIDRAHNGAYFHGHVEGKTGVRPATDIWLTLHRPVDANGEELPAHRDDALAVLHYESWSGEDFVRKWTALLAAGPTPAFRAAREPTAVALRTLVGRDIAPEAAQELLMRIFERTTADDVDTLASLGMLTEVDPSHALHEPASLTEEERQRLDGLLEAVARERKQPFHPGRPAAAVDKILADISGERSGLFRRR